jgi:RNA-directed DNA polymerase
MRPLGIPTMKDRAQQALYLLALAPVVETTADKNSYGFRQQRSCADAMVQCFLALRSANTQWILEGDIKSCFDKISHDWLLARVPMDRVILQKWLKSGYMEKHVLHDTTDGTPQGGIISPALANCALDGLERLLQEKYPAGKRLKSLGGEKPCVNLVRYADDFVITSKSKELLEGEIKPLVEQFLQERGLEFSPTKTVITHLEHGFDFLGQNVRRYPNGKLLIQPSKKERWNFPGGYPTSHQSCAWRVCRRFDRSTQPKDSRLGQLSSARGEQTHVWMRGSQYLLSSVAMGTTKAPEQVPALGQTGIL